MLKWAMLGVAVFFVVVVQVAFPMLLGPTAPRPDFLLVLVAFLAVRMLPLRAVLVGWLAGIIAGACSVSPVWVTAGSCATTALVVTIVASHVRRESILAETICVAAGVLAGHLFAGAVLAASVAWGERLYVLRRVVLASLLTAAVAPLLLVFFRAARFCASLPRRR